MLRVHRDLLKSQFKLNHTSRRFISDKFEVGDYAIITPLKKSSTKKTWLTRPLKDSPSAKANLNFGSIPHSELLNSSPMGKVHTIETRSQLAKYVCSRPTLEQWINYSKRMAAPIYSLDAQAIVSLTDMHIDYPEPPTEDGATVTPLQFLEAGTGHGSLTMAISKALHPANALAHYSKDLNLRGAVLHTIDCDKNHSITGKRTVKGFRRGIYEKNVEFHVCESPSKWIESEEGHNWIGIEKISKKLQNLDYDPDEPNAFLSGIFLDMPNYHEEMIKLTPYLKTGGFVVVFCPSITQIVDAIELIAIKNEELSKLDPPNSLHLEHERTVQLLDGAGGGLKEWDTRRTKIRATGKTAYSVRPKVGIRTVAGGFVSIWRKTGKDVNLEMELDLIDNYEPKPKEEASPVKQEEKTSAGELASKAFPVNSNSSSERKLTKEEKLALFSDDLLSSTSDVFQEIEEAKENEEILEDELATQSQLDLSTVNQDFKVEEATLIPHSVLHTVYRSHHGDPDVYAGYMANVYALETMVPEDLIEEVTYGGEVKEARNPGITEASGVSESAGKKTNVKKTWTKHNL